MMNPESRVEQLARDSSIALDALNPSAQNEVYATYSRTLRIVYENKDFTVNTAGEKYMFGLRTIQDGQPGFVTTNARAEADLKLAAREAGELARLSPRSEYHSIADRELASNQSRSTVAGVDYFSACDDDLIGMESSALIEYAEHLIEASRKSDDRIRIDRAEFGVSIYCALVRNSNGLSSAFSQSTADWYVMGMAREGDEVTSFDYDGGTVADAKSIHESINAGTSRFKESVLSGLGASSGHTYSGPVLLHPRAVASLLVGTIASNCNGRLHQDGMSPWTESMQELVAHPALTLAEDPLDQSRIQGWRPFDREGVATNPHALVKDGRLNFLGHNCYSARRGETTSTGNATGGARSQPGIGFSNLRLEFGSGIERVADEKLAGLLGDGILLTRFSGNQDAISGSFSGVAKNSFRIRGGKQDGSIREVMVAGNLHDLLRRPVAVGDTLHALPSGTLVPYLIVDGVSVTAG